MKKLLIATLVTFGASSAMAAGDAGCGLGSVIISKNSKGLQLLAMTTNHMFFTQPLGITFGTSGCSSRGLVMNEKEMQYYVELNQQELIQEMANAEGEKLTTLASLAGCQNLSGQVAFADLAQKRMSAIVPTANTTSTEMVQNIKTEIMNSGDALNSCHGS